MRFLAPKGDSKQKENKTEVYMLYIEKCSHCT